jgi:hypothetical protein
MDFGDPGWFGWTIVETWGTTTSGLLLVGNMQNAKSDGPIPGWTKKAEATGKRNDPNLVTAE